MEHGLITTEELEKTYGYNHPPRAARDVREYGIPLKTIRIKSSDGKRSIGAYTFGDLSQIRNGRLDGRTTFPKWLKDELYENNGGKCDVCSGHYEYRYLQVDHKIPYEIAGETSSNGSEWNVDDYMLLCGSCNRAKLWSCEHCRNWLNRVPDICTRCYWGNPSDYKHVALKEVRRTDLLWEGQDVEIYEKLKEEAKTHMSAIPDYIKTIIENHLNYGK